MGKKETVSLQNARRADQLAVMEQIVTDEVCPFCPDHFVRYHKKPTIAENDSWILTSNQWPYKRTRRHLLLVLKRHAETVSELTSLEWADLGGLVQYAEQTFMLPGGAVAMRFGDPIWSGGTVRHLHAQIVVPKINPATGLPFSVPIWTGTFLK